MNLHDLLSMDADAALAEGFARTLAELAGEIDPAALASLRLAASAISRASADGHTCIGLVELPGIVDAGLPVLRAQLLASGLVARAGDGEVKPLVLDDDRLYLNRFHATEGRVARALRHLAGAATDAGDAGSLLRTPPQTPSPAPVDLPQRAVDIALAKHLTVVSGGPGTGKTTTVVRILARLLEVHPGCRIVLTAPTGKAAARLRNAVQAGAETLPQGRGDALPKESFTIHRLLDKARSDGGRLACDVLVVDEASMLDLMLADRLLAALDAGGENPPRLILLGDRHQLAAVEAGAVFAEISDADARTHPLLHQCAIELTHSWRFGADTALGRVAAATRRGDVDAALGALADDDARWIDDPGNELASDTLEALAEGYAAYREAVRARVAPTLLFAALGAFRVLCAVRKGPRGVDALNESLSRRFRAQLGAAAGTLYAGQPLLVTRNDHRMRLYNGDVGIVLPAAGDAGSWVIAFEDAALPGGIRLVNPARLPPHETAFAMTVHKAQGSEFDRVALVLPAARAPVCTRELVYTGITRARKAVAIYAGETVLRGALATPTVRRSGLRQRLAEAYGER